LRVTKSVSGMTWNYWRMVYA